METVNVIVKLVAFIIIALGVIAIYDARRLSEKLFSFEDKNTSTKILKIIGFVLAIIGGIIIILNK